MTRRRVGTVLPLTLTQLLLLGCESPEQHRAVLLFPDAPPFLTSQVDLGRFAELPEWSIGTAPEVEVAGAGGNPFHRVAGATLLSGGGMVVASAGTHQVHFYAPDGDLVASAGGRGDGPEEYRSIQFLGLTAGDTVVVHDAWHLRLRLYDRAGRFIRGIDTESLGLPLGPEILGVFGEGTLVFGPGRILQWPQGIHRDTVPLFSSDLRGMLGLDTFAIIPGGEWYGLSRGTTRAPLPYGARLEVNVHGNRMVIALTDQYRAAVMDETGNVLRVIDVAVPTAPVSSTALDAWRSQQLSTLPDGQARDRARPMVEEVEPADSMPRLTGTLLDDAGRVWIGSYSGSPGARRRWTVYSESGSPVGHVPLPSAFTPLDSRGDRILGVLTDALGVETIQVWRLEHRGQPDRQ